MVQEELFREENNAWQSKNIASFLSNQHYTISLDKILLLLIAFVVLFVLTYSFGYEKGRRAMEKKIESLTAQIESVTSLANDVGQQVEKITGVPAVAPVNLEQPLAAMSNTHSTAVVSDQQTTPTASVTETQVPEGKYTIQVVTLLGKEQAERESGRLVKKGLRSFYFARGKFFEVCVGAFDSVANAKTMLGELKSERFYADAFIRPMPQV